MCRTIRRRDVTRPAFWYLSFIGPHPPVWPLRGYLDQYCRIAPPPPIIGDWARDPDALPWLLRSRQNAYAICGALRHERDLALRAFYATMTHIDHQIRIVIGTLREQGLLDNTIIAFTSDHGDMLGTHGQWAKPFYYEMAAQVPLIVLGRRGDGRVSPATVDDRLAETRDIMPTLLDLAGVPIPATVEGRSLVGDQRREYLFARVRRGPAASAMVRDERHKLIYYAAGNRLQLFDMQDDRQERHDLAAEPGHREVLGRLTGLLIENLGGEAADWIRDGRLVGVAEPPLPGPDRGLQQQRGLRFS
jgi:arylsulfatase A-like enzyme